MLLELLYNVSEGTIHYHQEVLEIRTIYCVRDSFNWFCQLSKMRIIPNQSGKRFVSRFMKKDQKLIQLNPGSSDTSIRMNPNQPETKFFIQINPISDWSKRNFQSESIRIITTLDSFKLGFRLVQIHSDGCFGINRINFLSFFIKRDTKRFADWFGMIRIG